PRRRAERLFQLRHPGCDPGKRRGVAEPARSRRCTRGMKRALVLAAALLLIGACGDDSGSGNAAGVPAGAHQVGGGCGATALYTGASEDWTSSAQGPTDLAQAAGHDGNAGAFLFAPPLRAGEPENPATKILWVVKEPRGVSDLV